jgi:hypothetical protein
MKGMQYTINNLIPRHKVQVGGYNFSHVVFKNPFEYNCNKFLNKINFENKNRYNNIKMPLNVKKQATLDSTYIFYINESSMSPVQGFSKYTIGLIQNFTHFSHSPTYKACSCPFERCLK